MNTQTLDLLLLRNPDGAWALTLPGPEGTDRLRLDCKHKVGAGRGWIAKAKLGRIVEAARRRWPALTLQVEVESDYNGHFVVNLWPRDNANYMLVGVGASDEARICAAIHLALIAEGCAT